MSDWTIHAHAYYDRSMMALAVGVFRVKSHGSAIGERHILTETGWVTYEPGEYRAPTLYLEKGEAVALAESLRLAGVRIESDLQSEGHKGALELHLDDMRRIAGQKIGVVLRPVP